MSPLGGAGVVLAVRLLAASSSALAGPELEPLERLWNEHMLMGTEGRYVAGKPSDYRSREGYESAAGAVTDLTNRGIGVSDLSGHRLFGFIQGVGWGLHGGLLARIRVADGFLELYGRRVIRWKGGWLGLDTFARQEDLTYDFFLLSRATGAARATILRKWSIPPEDVSWTQAAVHEIVRGLLSYEAATTTAVVTVTGLRRPHEYRVDVADVVVPKP